MWARFRFPWCAHGVAVMLGVMFAASSHRLIKHAVLRQWRTSMMARALRPRTIDERLRVVSAVCWDVGVEPERLSAGDVLGWLATKRAPNTRWSYFVHIHAFFRWCVVAGIRDDDPLANIPAPRRRLGGPRPVEWEHVEAVLEGRLHRRTRLMIVLAAFAGLRVHEIAKVHSRDYDAAAGFLTVEGKGGQVAVVPVHPVVRELADGAPVGWWFPSPKGGHVSSRAVGATISRAFARHGVVMTAHQLRHSFGTALVEAGVDIRVAQTLMRHESIASTAIYVRVGRGQQVEALARLRVPGRTVE